MAWPVKSESTHIVLRPATCMTHQEPMVPTAPIPNMARLRSDAVSELKPACLVPKISRAFGVKPDLLQTHFKKYVALPISEPPPVACTTKTMHIMNVLRRFVPLQQCQNWTPASCSCSILFVCCISAICFLAASSLRPVFFVVKRLNDFSACSIRPFRVSHHGDSGAK